MMKIEFVKPVYDLKEIPQRKLPTVVLCGRSNVGKSSFINSLFKTGIAQTSSQPGKTRSINYYLVDNKFYIVDLPGFGYAKVSKTERDSWQQLVEKYFSIDKNIQMAFHLVDSRHAPMQLDILLNGFLRLLGIPYVILQSKSDKLKHSELARSKIEIEKTFPEVLFGENCFFYSAVKGTGQKEVSKLLSSLF